MQQYGRLDVACNNAGIGGDLAPTADYPLEGWDRVIGINLSGVFYCMKYQIPQMLQAGGGAIVNMASILGAVGFANAPAYSAAKHGVLGLTRTAAAEYGAQGVRVNAVGPGFIHTPMIAGAGRRPRRAAATHRPAPDRAARHARGSGGTGAVAQLTGGVVRHRRVLSGGRRLPGALRVPHCDATRGG